jgi:hypothetical protein
VFLLGVQNCLKLSELTLLLCQSSLKPVDLLIELDDLLGKLLDLPVALCDLSSKVSLLSLLLLEQLLSLLDLSGQCLDVSFLSLDEFVLVLQDSKGGLEVVEDLLLLVVGPSDLKVCAFKLSLKPIVDGVKVLVDKDLSLKLFSLLLEVCEVLSVSSQLG